MILVGVTGGIGQGKTTVSRMLRELAGAGPECDLETSYIIAEVANAWIATWPPTPLKVTPGQDAVGLANELIKTLPAAVRQKLDTSVTSEQLKIERNDESLAFHHQLTGYLQARLAAGPAADELFPAPITPANKALHRQLFMWLGACLVVKVGPNIWGNALERRIKALAAGGQGFVTVGGIRSKYEVKMIHRNGGLVVRVVRPEAQANTDLTERFMREVVPDVEVINNGSFEELKGAVKRLHGDLAGGRLRSNPISPQRYRAA
ncbi:hypothetical protein KY386_01685 [Candidatus Parcubacteria bacterium]|nr:hypothetical protein [Candidatus Parcubacteria bacterium]